MTALAYNQLALPTTDELLFGVCRHPVTTRKGMVIGGGVVYPELNFTLPTMTVEPATYPRVRSIYRDIIKGSLERAAQLSPPGVQIEFETVPSMTEDPAFASELVAILLEEMENAHSAWGLKSVLRMTPNDNREMERPPRMRDGKNWDDMIRLFELSAAQGAELLSIESTGGKELHDEALMTGNIAQSIFALCILGVRDMRHLWTNIVDIAARHNVVAAGDTACAFGNTAMALAEQQMIPRVFAAVVRPVSAVRSLVAYEVGAKGPGKDCGYENPILKAITGFPMAMEGKSASCAHHSAMGNVASAMCDLWSNESVQHVRLLANYAPVCSMESLIYDCRLMNQALHHGHDAARQLRDWLSESDAALDPQAFVLTPESTIAFARTIVAAPDHYTAGRNVALQAVQMMRAAHASGDLVIRPNEIRYLDMMESQLDELPDSEEAFIAEMMDQVDTTCFRLADYDLQ
jgi:methanol--5-hydroxybenzimidazolylcobamide Co-methyltransferase